MNKSPPSAVRAEGARPTTYAKGVSEIIAAISAALALIFLIGFFTSGLSRAESNELSVTGAEFTNNGEVKLPVNWRSWVFVGANLTPNGLNDGKAMFPEFHYTYMEPTAWEHFKRTGKFAEGTQIVKELVLLADGADKNPDGSILESPGRGFYAGKPIVLALEYKDSKRFPDAPGGWGFFDFSTGSGQPYKATATVHPYENCAACHELAKDTDYVFTQHYPVLLERRSEYAPITRK